MLAHVGLGRAFPFETSDILSLTTSFVLFMSYLYLARTVVRLPFALVIAIRSTQYAQYRHGLSGLDSLREGFTRGFLDTRRWTVPPLASVDRLAVIGLTLLATIPYLGNFLINLGGAIGIAVLLIIYLLRGTFSFLIDDRLDKSLADRRIALPFLDHSRR